MSSSAWTVDRFLDLAMHVAQAASDVLMQRPSELTVVGKSSPTDAVTQMDTASERLISELLLDARPHDALLGEEEIDSTGQGTYRWVVDPIDGTVNYLYDLPGWSVSIGLEREGVPIVGVVAVPTWGRVFYGAIDRGAYELPSGGSPVRLATSSTSQLAMALVGTGFSYRTEQRAVQAATVAGLLPKVRDIRRLGSAAVDLCCVASGRLDGFYETGLNVWDHTAASVIVRQAGGMISGLRDDPPTTAMVLAGNARIQPQLATALRDLLDRPS